MKNIKITDVRVNPGDSAFLIDNGNVAILYDTGFAFTGYAVAEKIKNILVSDEELTNAKNNIIGKQQFITETNAQQSNLMAYYAISGKSYDYQKQVIDSIKKVSAEELKACANKYFTEDFVLAILKP